MATQYLNIPVLPADIAFGLMADFQADTHPDKVSLIAGAYRDEKGNPWVLPSVKEAKQRIALDPSWSHEYLGIAGSKTLTTVAKTLIFGTDLAEKANIASIQAVSGTSANHLGALFLAKHLKPKRVFIPDPTWVNHHTIWTEAAQDIEQLTYPYSYVPGSRSVDVDRIIAKLETEAHPNDVIVLQACAHNPTGIDLSQEEWVKIADVVQRKRLFVLFDSAYQGFATGDVDGDAWSVRYFTKRFFDSTSEHIPGLCVAQSFSKNFGLYGERVGALHLVVPGGVSTDGAQSQLSLMARAEYSNPPRFGAQIVEMVLGCPELKAQWNEDLVTMSSRIKKMRTELRRKLDELGARGDWSHIEAQIGMFSYTGLRKDQVQRLQDDYHIYMLPSGRVSICGLNEGNIDYVAKGIVEVVNS
ncbi:hypothetical protein ASPWEDRAFT_122425 [Aspergillus wentii DTO 134E9]|uniref:Aspartate aminotransferase n=1 Tax=Aspergillus wentii DTO 134E9 TaxID=1073089 RepID=A0A1L9R4J3_ASPWE|nr:uncharacterized protein ASPWEDRAFT_122425 [Aspergillus wentii DTO 134E9]OJJ29839.1 hypothetical protein ASPWEDRAFT_122425 [Aspergillus wentii DTO 134E9]